MSNELCKYDAATTEKIPGESDGVKYPTRYTIKAKNSILCRVIKNQEVVGKSGIVLPDSWQCQEFPTAAYIVKVGDLEKEKFVRYVPETVTETVKETVSETDGETGAVSVREVVKEVTKEVIKEVVEWKDKYPWAKEGCIVRYPMHSGQLMSWMWSEEDFIFLHCDAVYAYMEADNE